MSKVTIKRGELTPLTDEQKARFKRLVAKEDSEIDTSDIPELNAALWSKGERGKFYKPTKTTTTVRIDSDVIHWLKSQGKGYQTRMNTILRNAMIEDEKEHS